MKAIAIVALLGSTAVAGRDTAHYELAWNGSAYTVGKRTIAADRARVLVVTHALQCGSHTDD